MANYMRDEAEESADQKLKNMLGTKVRTADLDNHDEYGAPDRDSTAGLAPDGYADDYRKGDKVVSRIGKTEGPIEGKKSKSRLDRPAYARGGAVKGKGTNVNIVIAPQGASSPPPAGLPVPPGAMPLSPSLPPGVPAGAPPMPMPGRKRGGRVGNYDAGAGSGLGRLEKIANYGKNAKAK